jgi:hypothetical protein
MKGKRCPTPHKVAHVTRGEAEKHAGSLYAREGPAALVKPYKCRCGAWHVGGRRKKFGRRRVQR